MTSKRPAVAFARRLARRAGVPEPPFTWSITEGPWFDNMLATVQLDGPSLVMKWESATIDSAQDTDPELHTVHEFKVVGQAPAVPTG
jgi:hypothetical protein